MGPIESMGQYDWAHLDLLYKNQIGNDQSESNHSCMLLLVYLITMPCLYAIT